jgi:hypothetical protein
MLTQVNLCWPSIISTGPPLFFWRTIVPRKYSLFRLTASHRSSQNSIISSSFQAKLLWYFGTAYRVSPLSNSEMDFSSGGSIPVFKVGPLFVKLLMGLVQETRCSQPQSHYSVSSHFAEALHTTSDYQSAPPRNSISSTLEPSVLALYPVVSLSRRTHGGERGRDPG